MGVTFFNPFEKKVHGLKCLVHSAWCLVREEGGDAFWALVGFLKFKIPYAAFF
jgi:hypothetical protein